jgi:hypothetical protein
VAEPALPGVPTEGEAVNVDLRDHAEPATHIDAAGDAAVTPDGIVHRTTFNATRSPRAVRSVTANPANATPDAAKTTPTASSSIVGTSAAQSYRVDAESKLTSPPNCREPRDRSLIHNPQQDPE